MKRNTGHVRRFPPTVRRLRDEDFSAEMILAALADPFGCRPPVPQQFRGAGSRGKSYCRWCDLVLRSAADCPQCGKATLPMPKSWRPGRKGTRTRVWDMRVSRRRRPYSAPPDVVRQLGVKGLLSRPSVWYAPDPVRSAIAQRGIAQRARRRRNRNPQN